jgi:hypothetical protein
MRRRASKVLTFSSCIFAVLIGAVWLRSYVQFDLIKHREVTSVRCREYLLGWSRGRVNVSFAQRDPDVAEAVSEEAMQWDWDVDQPVILRTGRSTMNGYGFSLVGNTAYYPAQGQERGSTLTRYGFVLPCWVMFGASMVLPTIAWRRGTRIKPKDPLPDPV